MSENTNEVPEAEATETATEGRSSIREFRHAAKAALANAQAKVSRRTTEGDTLYRLVNGVISGILNGRQGLSVEGQVKQLDRAIRQVKQNQSQVADAAAAAQESVVAEAQAKVDRRKERLAEAEAALAALNDGEGFSGLFAAALDETAAILTEAKQFAQERDFAAHQEAKGNPVGTDEGPDGGPVDIVNGNAPVESDEDETPEDEQF